MSGEWRVADPRDATRGDTKVVRVDVPLFRDETDYEGITGRYLTAPAWDDFFRGGGVVVLATEEGERAMRGYMEGAVALTPGGLRQELERLARDRQIVALRRL